MELYIVILEKANNNALPETVVSDTTLTYQSVLDLIDMGYLTGSQVATPKGSVIRHVAITESGQRFLARNSEQSGVTEGGVATAFRGQLLVGLVMLILFICFVAIFKYFRL